MRKLYNHTCPQFSLVRLRLQPQSLHVLVNANRMMFKSHCDASVCDTQFQSTLQLSNAMTHKTGSTDKLWIQVQRLRYSPASRKVVQLGPNCPQKLEKK